MCYKKRLRRDSCYQCVVLLVMRYFAPYTGVLQLSSTSSLSYNWFSTLTIACATDMALSIVVVKSTLWNSDMWYSNKINRREQTYIHIVVTSAQVGRSSCVCRRGSTKLSNLKLRQKWYLSFSYFHSLRVRVRVSCHVSVFSEHSS